MADNIITTYRPKALEEVVGNKNTVKSFQKAFEKKTAIHAILLSGPTGCGKTTLAHIWANQMGCADISIHEINCADKTGRDDVRDIIERIKGRPLTGGNVALIMDECHELSSAAQNTLLKVVENCPDHVYFAFCSTLPNKIIATLKNRLVKFTVQQLTNQEIIDMLGNIAEHENAKVSDSILKTIARISEGIPRDAITLLAKVLWVNEKEALSLLSEEEDEDNPEVIKLATLLIQAKRWELVLELYNDLKENYDSGAIHAILVRYYGGWFKREGNENVATALSYLLNVQYGPYHEASLLLQMFRTFSKIHE